MSATASASLELVPPQELAFTLSAAEATPRVTLTLKHPGATQEALAFKVTIRHGALQSPFRLSIDKRSLTCCCCCCCCFCAGEPY